GIRMSVQVGPEYAPVGNFHKSYILKTLHNVAAYGCYITPNIEPIEGYFPPLITKEEFELNLALMKSRDKRGGRIGKGFPNIFTGKLIFCANCEGRMVYRSKGAGFRNSRFLHCSNSERSNISVCSCPIFNYIEFETFFMKFITELDIDTLFNKDSIEHNQKVINEITVLELEIQKIEHQYSNIIASLDDAPEEIRQDIYKSAISKKAGIKTINDKILKLRYEIHTSNKENDSIVLRDNIQKYDEYTKNKALDQITEIRRDLNNQIFSVISKITIFNDFKFTDNNTNNIPNTILDIAHKRGYNTEEKKVKYLQSAKTGKKLFNEYYRFFIVEFKNGQKRHVIPFLDYSKSTSQVLQAQIERQELLAENLKKLKEKYGIDLDKLVNL
ncbi:MAG: zinc ribbon domain-containing protein, partial [Methylococcales bacterium]|nr:zinc ribbon domain-containing protein [Methylococcales bacterium]